MTDYQKHRWFGLYDYVRLNQTLVWLADYTEQYYKKEDKYNQVFASVIHSQQVCIQKELLIENKF